MRAKQDLVSVATQIFGASVSISLGMTAIIEDGSHEPEELPLFKQPTAVGGGIGSLNLPERTEERLHQAGITTLGELARTDLEQVETLDQRDEALIRKVAPRRPVPPPPPPGPKQTCDIHGWSEVEFSTDLATVREACQTSMDFSFADVEAGQP